MKIAGGAPAAAPVATGSVEPSVALPGPLPPSLDQSDAAAIGRTALEAAASQNGTGEWTNARTGSSGKLALLPDTAAGGAGACRSFGTTVTSIGGVHRYSGTICRDPAGSPALTAITLMTEEAG
nr:RT0821/Lpp0805 family surface protein [Propylenella binzhouense]